MRTETLSFDTPGGSTTAYVALPDNPSQKAVIIVQEYWGLVDHIKNIANRYADEGFIAVTPDLYRGKVGKNSGEASQLMGGLQVEDGLGIIKTAMSVASAKYGLTHFGITGFCMGGTYALRAACLLEGVSAAAPFYGDIPEESVLEKLRVPTIFISGIHDNWINPEKVARLEDVTERYELPINSIKYDADHAFFNDTRPEVYNEAAAKDAWSLVVGLFNDKL